MLIKFYNLSISYENGDRYYNITDAEFGKILPAPIKTVNTTTEGGKITLGQLKALYIKMSVDERIYANYLTIENNSDKENENFFGKTKTGWFIIDSDNIPSYGSITYNCKLDIIYTFPCFQNVSKNTHSLELTRKLENGYKKVGNELVVDNNRKPNIWNNSEFTPPLIKKNIKAFSLSEPKNEDIITDTTHIDPTKIIPGKTFTAIRNLTNEERSRILPYKAKSVNVKIPTWYNHWENNQNNFKIRYYQGDLLITNYIINSAVRFCRYKKDVLNEIEIWKRDDKAQTTATKNKRPFSQFDYRPLLKFDVDVEYMEGGYNNYQTSFSSIGLSNNSAETIKQYNFSRNIMKEFMKKLANYKEGNDYYFVYRYDTTPYTPTYHYYKLTDDNNYYMLAEISKLLFNNHFVNSPHFAGRTTLNLYSAILTPFLFKTYSNDELTKFVNENSSSAIDHIKLSEFLGIDWNYSLLSEQEWPAGTKKKCFTSFMSDLFVSLNYKTNNFELKNTIKIREPLKLKIDSTLFTDKSVYKKCHLALLNNIYNPRYINIGELGMNIEKRHILSTGNIFINSWLEDTTLNLSWYAGELTKEIPKEPSYVNKMDYSVLITFYKNTAADTYALKKNYYDAKNAAIQSTLSLENDLARKIRESNMEFIRRRSSQQRAYVGQMAAVRRRHLNQVMGETIMKGAFNMFQTAALGFVGGGFVGGAGLAAKLTGGMIGAGGGLFNMQTNINNIARQEEVLDINEKQAIGKINQDQSISQEIAERDSRLIMKKANHTAEMSQSLISAEIADIGNIPVQVQSVSNIGQYESMEKESMSLIEEGIDDKINDKLWLHFNKFGYTAFGNLEIGNNDWFRQYTYFDYFEGGDWTRYLQSIGIYNIEIINEFNSIVAGGIRIWHRQYSNVVDNKYDINYNLPNWKVGLVSTILKT